MVAAAFKIIKNLISVVAPQQNEFFERRAFINKFYFHQKTRYKTTSIYRGCCSVAATLKQFCQLKQQFVPLHVLRYLASRDRY